MARIVFFTAALTLALGADPRPSNEEWKEAKAGVAEEAAAAKAKEAKMSAVNKVVDLLENLKGKVLAEGEEEAQTYNKFACFCKDTTADKTASIQQGTDKSGELASLIESESSARNNLDEAIATLISEITASQDAMKAAAATRADELKVYNTNAEDLKGALAAIDGAIASVKSSKGASLVQLRDARNTIHTAMLLADALGLSMKGVPAAFLQADPEVAMENYKFHSNDIIATLEKLQVDFKSEKADVDAAEVEAVNLHNKFMQEQTDLVKLKNSHLEDAKKDKAMKQANIAQASAERSTTAAVLLDDQLYLRKLSEMCSDKAATWDQRSGVRQDELSALTAAITVVQEGVATKTSAKAVRFAQTGVSVKMAETLARDPAWMEAVEAEAEAEEAPQLAFFQRAARLQHVARARFLAPTAARKVPVDTDGGRRAVAELLRTSGLKLKSTLLTSLAMQVTADPLAKVKTLIQELIERLLQEAANEGNQKDWCNKATADAEQKRDYASTAVDEHNANMALLESQRDSLEEAITVLTEAIDDLEKKQAEAEKMRADEKAENALTVDEASAGLAAVEQAIEIIDRFYKTVAKETVDLSMTQTNAHHRQSPMDDAPDAGFKNGEAYKGGQGESTGIIGMMEVIKGDFTRTVSETKKAEAQAEQDHLEFMTETGKSLSEKNVAKDESTKQKDGAEGSLQTADDGLHTEMVILTTAVKELMELKPVCVDTGMSYEERVARRKDEIESLKKADCILTAYAEYGPDGLSDAC